MKVIIIEDEKLSAEHLEHLLKKTDKDIEVVARFDSVKSSLAGFKNGTKADLLFMDIHLADGLSFDLFAKFQIDTPVIFTTAYNEYAIKAFKYNSIDYLLKPIGLTELSEAIAKYKKLAGQHNILFKDLVSVYDIIKKPYKNRFMVKMGETLISVKAEDISHFIAEDGIVLLVTQAEKRYAIDYTLDELENLLDSSLFFRISRQTLVQINAIQKISAYFNSRLKISLPGLQEEYCIVSRERVHDFKKWLDA